MLVILPYFKNSREHPGSRGIRKYQFGRYPAPTFPIEEACSLGQPKLYARDNKASVLRGPKSIGGFLKQKNHVSVAIKTLTATATNTIEMSKTGSSISCCQNMEYTTDYDVKSDHFYTCYSMIRPSKHLARRIVLEKLDSRIIFKERCESNEDWPLFAPYSQLYPSHERISDSTSNLMGQKHRDSVAVLQRYITEEYGDDHRDANGLFQSGLVTKQHFSKHCGLDDVIFEKTSHGQLNTFTCVASPEGSALI
ncbi:hypothetical protein BJ878DRAFT_476771 [Calycina marina]|uniref:Uncharacterized protein n=1 Tax=Calycina marina TaxID=1763456 RepID=A0A9P7Z9N6_9HELO|nr:hypothetical protein BJ878DRAFT_476771 [Calycina marina]